MGILCEWLRLMLVASDQSPSTFLDFVVSPLSPFFCSSAYAVNQPLFAFHCLAQAPSS